MNKNLRLGDFPRFSENERLDRPFADKRPND